MSSNNTSSYHTSSSIPITTNSQPSTMDPTNDTTNTGNTNNTTNTTNATNTTDTTNTTNTTNITNAANNPGTRRFTTRSTTRSTTRFLNRPAIPKNEVTQRANLTASTRRAETAAALRQARLQNAPRVKAVYDFISEAENELGLTAGATYILDKDAETGWALGECVATGKTGWFPISYTEKVKKGEEEEEVEIRPIAGNYEAYRRGLGPRKIPMACDSEHDKKIWDKKFW